MAHTTEAKTYNVGIVLRVIYARVINTNISRAMAGIKQNGILGQLLRDSWLAFAEHLVQDRFMRIDMTDEERDILIRWKKRSDTLQTCENEVGGDCVRCPWCRPGYCRGDGRAGRGDGT